MTMPLNINNTMKTSYGQQLCRRYILATSDAEFIENFRPVWLFGMELDFYFPKHNVAIEFNGDQHYHATSLSVDPEPQKKRDWQKRRICKERGIYVITIKAIDLMHGNMRKRLRHHLPIKTKQQDGGSLGSDAIQYRKILKEKFSSPTACRKNKKPYMQALKKLNEKYRALYPTRFCK